MIKKIFVVSSLLLMTAFQASADDQSSGCGLGWAVTKRKSILSSLVRAYTNVTFSSTFGMSSGTSGCAQHSLVKNEKKGLHFTEANYHQLMVEMSSGQGEFLENYSLVLGCNTRFYPSFARTLRANYQRIFTHNQITPAEVYRNVLGELKADHVLAQECTSTII